MTITQTVYLIPMHCVIMAFKTTNMILQGSLRLVYMEISYLVNVKTILKDGVYYFYVTDKDEVTALLAGETIELSYSDSFCTAEKEKKMMQHKVPQEIVSTVEKLLLDNKELWHY